ncbi:MAG TPA: glycoside hydrolase family 15 protein [Steroidobacteraceae bacterium]|nr:glycoside hydrolase family 15 protein [Steroidobacteraceae bacterium]
MKRTGEYPPLADYALIGDCHSAALVSRQGSIDWCCLPRFDSDSCFGRLLDWGNGGYFQICPAGRCSSRREYLEKSLVLVTTFRSGSGEARLIDFFAMRRGGSERPRREIVRIIEGVSGTLRLHVRFVPRLDFAEVKPWIRPVSGNAYVAVGSNAGLLIFADAPLRPGRDHDLEGVLEVHGDSRHHFGVQFLPPEESERRHLAEKEVPRLEEHYEETLRWWRDWAAKIRLPDGRLPSGKATGTAVARSAIVLKALCYAPTGAIIAAPTTSLPEEIGGERNWDYRFCWLRDSIFTVHALSDLGLQAEAEGMRRFIQRTASGNASELQVLYAVDGKRRLPEIDLPKLDGWRGSRPVRIGNGAAEQFQADMYGLVMELSWRWSERGEQPDETYWGFLSAIVEVAIARRHLPDRGIWEVRSRPLHFVHSKVMCWAAVDGGIALAERYNLPAPLDRWREARDGMRKDIEKRGYDSKRGIFVRSYSSKDLDAALLLLPAVDFVAWDDERMVRTAQVIRRELSYNGLVRRYTAKDGLRGKEGVFVACTFWLAECLAHQRRRKEARQAFDGACRCANDLGLFAEEFQPKLGELLGNFPQGLTHLAHVSAALALEYMDAKPSPRSG